MTLAAWLAIGGTAHAQEPPPTEPPPTEPPPGWVPPPGSFPTEPPPGSFPPPEPAPGFGTDCANATSGPVTVTSVLARPPGGAFEDAREKVCVSLNYSESPEPGGGGQTRFASFSLSPKFGMGQDLSSVYPQGTLFDLGFESSGPAPLMVAGAFGAPAASFDGARLRLQGLSTAVRFAQAQGAEGPDCSSPTETLESFFGGGVMLEPDGEGPRAASLRRYRGAFFGTNAQNSGLPQVSPDGSDVTLQLSGCGDGDPVTADGFFTGFLPVTGTAEMGLARPLLASLPDAAVDQIMELQDNGKEMPAASFETAEGRDVALEPTPGAGGAPPRAAAGAPSGISVDYKLSFSAHSLSTSADPRDVKLAKRCKGRRGKLRVVRRGRGARAKKLLTCVYRKRPAKSKRGR